MSDPEQQPDESLWKDLDNFPEVNPRPDTKVRVWSAIARDEATSILTSRKATISALSWRAIVRIALPATAMAALILTFVFGGVIVLEKRKADREISENIELYENYEVIRNMGQIASYEETDETIFESIE